MKKLHMTVLKTKFQLQMLFSCLVLVMSVGRDALGAKEAASRYVAMSPTAPGDAAARTLS